MATLVPQLPRDYLRTISPTAADGFTALRDAVNVAGPIDFPTREFILVAAFATAGYEVAVKAHVERALGIGVTKEALQQAVLLTLGATTALIGTTRALTWIEEAAAAFNADHPKD